MDFPTLCALLKEWGTRIKDVCEFENITSDYYRNGKRAIQLFRELADFLRMHEPALRIWMTEYLAKNRAEIFVKWWSTHVSEWAKDQMNKFPKKKLHPHTQQEWDRLFAEEPEACFTLAKRVTADAHNRRDITQCDDLTILAIHEGRECDDDAWECYFCDTRDDAWTTELQRRLLHSSHPLLNLEKARFIYLSWRYKDALRALGDWTPPHFWGTVPAENRQEKDCYDLEEYTNYMRKRRAEDYGKTGQTPMQALEPMFFIPRYYGGWSIRYYEHYKTEYDAFILLWNKLDLLPVSLTLDLARLREIEEMY